MHSGIQHRRRILAVFFYAPVGVGGGLLARPLNSVADRAGLEVVPKEENPASIFGGSVELRPSQNRQNQFCRSFLALAVGTMIVGKMACFLPRDDRFMMPPVQPLTILWVGSDSARRKCCKKSSPCCHFALPLLQELDFIQSLVELICHQTRPDEGP